MTRFNRRFLGLSMIGMSISTAFPALTKDKVTLKMSERNQKLDEILAKAMPGIKAHWQNCREAGLEAMTPAATDAVDAEILSYFNRLKKLNDKPSDAQILAEMKRLYEKLNAINESHDYGLLETDERELLVTIFIDAAVACGIDAEKYDGEPGGEYRDF